MNIPLIMYGNKPAHWLAF